MSNITQAAVIRSVLPQVQERIAAGTFDDEELYVALCTIVRMNSETRSDAECESVADKIHDWISSRIA